MALIPAHLLRASVRGAILCVALAAPAAEAAEPTCPEAAKEHVAVWVRDAETAIKIARLVVEGSPFLGKYDNSRPLKAGLIGDTWVVGVDRSECLRRPLWVCRGGGPAVRVRQDGKVTANQQTH